MDEGDWLREKSNARSQFEGFVFSKATGGDEEKRYVFARPI